MAITREQILKNCLWVGNLSVGDTVAVYRGQEEVDGVYYSLYYKDLGKIVIADNELGFELEWNGIRVRATGYQLRKLV